MTSDKILVSTVLLTKNSAASLPAYFESMRDVDDIIVLDGNSTDGTQEIVKQWPNVRLFPQDPRYIDDKGYITDFSSLRNIGYSLARHRWIICIDSDEEASKGLLDAVRKIVAENKHGVYYVQREFYYEDKLVKQPSWIKGDHIRFFSLECVRGCLKPVHERLDIIKGSPIGYIDEPVHLPMTPPQYLRAKYDHYMAIEVNSYKNISFGRWFRWLFVRNIPSIVIRPFVYVSLYVLPGPGIVAPFIYDWEQMRYSWLVMWKSAPFLRWWFHPKAKTASQTTSI